MNFLSLNHFLKKIRILNSQGHVSAHDWTRRFQSLTSGTGSTVNVDQARARLGGLGVRPGSASLGRARPDPA